MQVILILCNLHFSHLSGISAHQTLRVSPLSTYRSCVSCWTSSCQCLLALSSALYIPLMCWITFFLSIPCDRDTACVISPAILEISLDFVSRRWKRLRKKKESCFNTSNRIENGSKPKLQSVLLSSKIPHVYNNHIGNSDGTCKHAAFQGSFRSAFKNVLTFVDYLPLFSPTQLCSHLLPSHTSSDPEEKFCYFSHLRNN